MGAGRGDACGLRRKLGKPLSQWACPGLRWLAWTLVMHAGVTLAAAASSRSRSLLQVVPQQPQTITVDPVAREVYSNSTVFSDWSNQTESLIKGVTPLVYVRADANYPDPVLDNPDGWRFKTVSNASVVLNVPAEIYLPPNRTIKLPAAIARINSFSNSKLAPAIALASGTVEGSGAVGVLSRNSARARPGVLAGVALAKGDFTAVNKAPFEPVRRLTDPTLVFVNQDAEAGQGQAVNLVNIDADGNNLVVGDSRGTATASRWYLSPGNAIMGQRLNVHGGQAAVFARNRARASIGSATSGVLNLVRGDGNIPYEHVRGRVDPIKTLFLVKHGGISRADNRAFVDLGSAQAGNVQAVHSKSGDATIVGLAQARTAEGEAIAGAVNVAVADNGDIYLGDYWDELTDPGNAVVASNIGRGPSQSGQINIGISPNQDVHIGGIVAATAAQGSAVAGAFTLANAQKETETDEQVTAVTAEYAAIAGNVGVGVAAERNAVSNSALAKTDTGSALAYDFATAVVAKQNSATSSARASTATGQAAGLAASQSIGGVQSDTQAAGLAKTTTGNALSVGSAISGSIFNSRAVSTSLGATVEGQAVSAGWSGAVSADSDASAASTASTTTGNAVSLGQGYGLGILTGKSTTVSSASTSEGSAGSAALGVATGLFNTDSIVTSNAVTKDGRAQSLAGALSLGGINSAAKATSNGGSQTGDVTSNAQAAAIGFLHGEASSTAVSGTGCVDCVSDAVSNAIAIGVVADASAAAKADSPKNPGNALANAIGLGLISRTSNGGSSRIAIGPGQAVTGGFAVSAPRKTAEAAAAALLAVNPADKQPRPLLGFGTTRGSSSQAAAATAAPQAAAVAAGAQPASAAAAAVPAAAKLPAPVGAESKPPASRRSGLFQESPGQQPAASPSQQSAAGSGSSASVGSRVRSTQRLPASSANDRNSAAAPAAAAAAAAAQQPGLQRVLPVRPRLAY